MIDMLDLFPEAPQFVHFFPGIGFRPAVWVPPHRGDLVDPMRLVIAPDADVPYEGKYTPPVEQPIEPYGAFGSGWRDEIGGVTASLGGPTPGLVTSAPGTPGTSTNPGWPSWPPCFIFCGGPGPDPNGPPVVEVPSEPPAPVPLPLSLHLMFTLVLIAVLAKPAIALGHWFMSVRGTGPGQFGWP